MGNESVLKPSDIRKATGLIARYRKMLASYPKQLALPSPTQSTRSTRSTLGETMPFSTYPAGAYSFPGPDITFTPPPSNPAVVSLGCLADAGNTEKFSITWPREQTPSNFATGSGQQRLRIVQNHPLTVVRPETNVFQAAATAYGAFNTDILDNDSAVSSSTIPNDGQPSTQTYLDPDEPGGGVSNVLLGGLATPFDSTITTSSADFITAISNGYSSIQLAQEGLLWTLWPLAKPTKELDEMDLFFDGFRFGTAKSSQYAIGQLGYFYNNMNLGCIPISASTANSALITPLIGGVASDPLEQLQLSTFSATHNTGGIQGFNETLTISTAQMLSILVVKVSEEVARIPNPAAGASSNERYFYVGYDGWAVIRTSNNPVAPMAAQTYVTPQSVTGSTTHNNYQVVIPPNFPSAIYFKNEEMRVPTNTQEGLIPIIPCAGFGPPYFGVCNIAYYNHNFDPNSGPGPRPISTNPVTFQGPPPGVSAEQFLLDNRQVL